MKNALLLILFLFPIFCLAQNWGAKNSVWHYNQTMFMPPFNYDFIKFSVLGDTVIVGEDATIFQEDYFSLKDTVSSKLFMKSIDNRVYYFEPTLNAFQLLYDFNAVAGDTIQMFCRDEGQETYIKVKVDSVSKRNMNGTELKVQHVSTLQSYEYKYQMNGEIIENIGWTGFMFPLHRLADPPYGGNLRCFQNDDFELKLVDIDCDYLAIKNTDIHSYKPFNLENGVWYCKYLTKGGMSGVYHGTDYATDSVKYFCNGDTIINEILFKKLFYEGYSSSQNVPRTYFKGYYGAIRNDTLNKKVYFLGAGLEADYEGAKIPLYNFDLEVGDSTGINCYSTQEAIRVTSIDSVLFCNQYHRRFITSTGDDIIEGIGSIYGLFPLNCPLANGWLICYQEKENDECVDCNLFTSSEDFANIVKIYPNPTNGQIRISPVTNIRSIEIYDFQGKLIEKKTNDFEEIILKNNGIYILRIKSDDKLIIYKVVKN